MRCAGFSLRCLLLLWSTGSRCTGFSSCGSRALEHRLSSCGTWAQLLHSMWDLPGPGLEPVSLALAGGFLTTAPPGKPNSKHLNEYTVIISFIHEFFQDDSLAQGDKMRTQALPWESPHRCQGFVTHECMAEEFKISLQNNRPQN